MKVFIGYDSREIRAFYVCRHSLVRHASDIVEANPLKHATLRKAGYFNRAWDERKGVMYDRLDGKPFSTEFAFTRFLVPVLNHYQGWALFMDCDMLIRGDIKEVFDLRDPTKAVMCVKHVHKPKEVEKMDGVPQEAYRRKNWSSFVLWNCGHAANKCVTPDMVNTQPGSYLHAFEWLEDDLIGSLPVKWNWLEGYSSERIKPKNVHYTRGGPWFPDYRDVAYAEDWRAEERMMRKPLPHEWACLEVI